VLEPRRSALEGHDAPGDFGAGLAEGPGIEIAERRGLAVIQLEGPAGDEGFLQAVEQALGFALPLDSGGSVAAGPVAALWIGPNRWLLPMPEDKGKDLLPDLSAALIGRRGGITELGHARTVVRLSGRDARALLSKGCSLDLHPSVFPPGSVAGSILAALTATLHHVEDGAFDLYVFRSFGLALWEWLQEAGEEYGVRIAPAITG
jgi:sarcosine oxidase subunit gamma